MTHDPRFAEFLDDLQRGRMTRRTALRRAAMIGLSASAGAGIIAARFDSAQAQGKTRVRLAVWAGVEEANQLQAVVDRINAAAADFEIVSEPQPADYLVRLQTTLAGGTAADLFWLSQEQVRGYADRGALLDLTDRLAADQAPAADLDDYFPTVLETARYQDAIYGLPWVSQPCVLYYNPALFQAAGVAEPTEAWDWQAFREAAAQLTDPAKNVYGTTFNSWPPLRMFIWQAGGEEITADLSACPIDSPEAVQAADFYASIAFNEEVAVPEAVIAERGFDAMAKAGQVAMFIGGAADNLDYAHTQDPQNAEMRVALVPRGPKDRTTFAYAAVTAVNAASENPDAAYKALVALTDGIHHWKVVAPRQSLANVETIVASVPEKEASAATIVQAAGEMRALRTIPQQSEWDQIFNDDFVDPLIHGEGTAQELAEAIRPDLENLLP